MYVSLMSRAKIDWGSRKGKDKHVQVQILFSLNFLLFSFFLLNAVALILFLVTFSAVALGKEACSSDLCLYAHHTKNGSHFWRLLSLVNFCRVRSFLGIVIQILNEAIMKL
jgi:hypothetical protein